MKIFEKLQNRFKQLQRDDYIIIGFLTLVMVLAYYFSISFSVKMGQGYTLFGDSGSFSDAMETKGPTQADITVLILFWCLTAILTAIFVFLVFFKKKEDKKIVKKEIINGRTVVVKDKEDEDK